MLRLIERIVELPSDQFKSVLDALQAKSGAGVIPDISDEVLDKL
jgi:hypothetical protein